MRKKSEPSNQIASLRQICSLSVHKVDEQSSSKIERIFWFCRSCTSICRIRRTQIYVVYSNYSYRLYDREREELFSWFEMKTVVVFIRNWCLSRTDTTKQGTVYFTKIHIQTGHKTRLLILEGKLFSLEIKIFPLKINYFSLKFNSGSVQKF